MCSQYVLRALPHPNHACNKQNALSEGPPVTGVPKLGSAEPRGSANGISLLHKWAKGIPPHPPSVDFYITA